MIALWKLVTTGASLCDQEKIRKAAGQGEASGLKRRLTMM